MFGKCGIGGWCTSFYNLETDDDAAACNHPNADQGFEQLQNNQNRTACCGVSDLEFVLLVDVEDVELCFP